MRKIIEMIPLKIRDQYREAWYGVRKTPLNYFLRQLGYEIKPISKFQPNYLEPYFDKKRLLKDNKVSIIFDVGANIGLTVAEYKRFFPKATIYGFEPSEDSFTQLLENCKKLESIYLYKLAISDQTGEHEFYINEFCMSNSLLKVSSQSDKYVDSNLTRNLGSTKVKTITLDEFCQQQSITRINILKMDIQGGELNALKGSVNLLKEQSIDLIYTEVLFAELYKNQGYFFEVYSFLIQYGYILYKIYGLSYGNNGVLAWGDVIFISPKLEKELKP